MTRSNNVDKSSVWREFCYDLVAARERDAKEAEYQLLIENGLRQMGWSKADGEICPKERLEVGSHGQLEPDITMKISNRPVFVIEVKRPNNNIKERQEIQLLSYMRMRNTPIGVYIGKDIRLYYDHRPSEQNVPPYMAWRTDVDADAKDGNDFIEFFHRDTFNENRILNYCVKSYEEKKTNDIMATFQNALRTDQNKAMHDVLTEYFVNYKKCNPEIVKSMLKHMIFTTSSNTQSTDGDSQVSEQHSFGMVTINNGKSNRKDTTKYALDGRTGMFGKGKFVREIVARFVENNPTFTYNQLKQIFPDRMQGSYGVIRSLDELEKSTHNRKDLATRYVMDKDKQLISSDGVRFVVCTQWGSYNFDNILNLMNKWGWTIIKSEQ